MKKNDQVAKKMGRPTLAGEARKIMLRIRVNEEDLENLDKKCKEAKKTRSELLRDFMNE